MQQSLYMYKIMTTMNLVVYSLEQNKITMYLN